MKNAILKTIEQSDNVSLYSICFNGSDISEFEDFLMKFKDNSTLNQDFQRIIVALEKIIERGALERFFRMEGKMSDHLTALSRFDELLKQAQKKGSITIEKNMIIGIENKTVEL